jgi:Carboxypeptidase regulatory-like domain/TonB-dependent Receptor Plug Domain
VRCPSIVLLLIIGFISVGSTRAQSPNGTISGLVLDPSGGAIVSAEVTVVNDSTRVQYFAKTNAEGIYVVSNLPPGSYRIQVERLGFKTVIKPEITLNVLDALAINFTLPLGAVSEIVTVAGGAPLINTENAAVSTVVDRKFVETLPLNGRSFNTLLQLTPGVVIAPSNASQPGQFSIGGQRTDANNFVVDGVSANFGVSPNYLGQTGVGNAQALSALGGTSSLVSVEALQEFRIETSTFAPELGRSPGGQVILTTRSGTNRFHGEAYEYFRNTVMDANDWFANDLSLRRLPERHNDFGGFAGGPISRDKTFFFFSYEGARLDLPQVSSLQVPSAYARSVASSSEAPFLNAFPQPNDGAIIPGVYTAQFTGGSANKARLNASSIRIDRRLGDRFSIFGRYNYAPSDTVTRGGRGVSPNSVATTTVDTQTLTLGVTMSLGNQMSNSLRGNYSAQKASDVYSMDTFGGAVPLATATSLGGVDGANTYAYFYTFDTALAVTGPYARNQTKQINFVDDLSISAGRHALKVGGDYRLIFLDANPRHNSLVLVSPSVQTFLSTQKVTVTGGTNIPSELLSQALSLYAQDSWKVHPRVTVTYGVRWELSPAPSARGKTTLAAWENVDDPSRIALAPRGTALWKTQFASFGPRLGVAYAPRRKGDLVFRVGGGLFYDLSVGSSAQLALEFPNIATARYTGVAVPLVNGPSYFPATSLTPPYPTAAGVAPDLVLPRSYQWSVAMEKTLGPTQALSASYVGQAGRDLLRTQGLYRPNVNFRGEFLLMKNDALSNYNALQLQYRRRVSQGLQALASYTFSHSLDNASNDQVIGLSNAVISGASDYASSDFDVRQSFSGGLTYVSPARSIAGPLSFLTKNWTVGGVVVARTGFPFNAVVFSSSPDPGGYANSRPDRVLGQPLYVYGSQCIALLGLPCAGGKGLNPAAFVVPASSRQGSEGRNDIPGFSLTQVDASLGRKISVTERMNIQFRVDAFNILNHPNFTNPLGYVEYGPFYLQSQQMLNQSLGGLNPLFQEGGPRSLQLSLKFAF